MYPSLNKYNLSSVSELAKLDLKEIIGMIGEVDAKVLWPELQKYMQAENSVNQLIDFW